MQRRIRKFISFFLVFTLVCELVPLDFMGQGIIKVVEAADIVASGNCGVDGNNVVWTITEDTTVDWDLVQGTPYKLTITGSGAMADFVNEAHTQWYSYSSYITSISVGEGVTTIGDFAFSMCVSLVTVSLPSSLLSIGDYAFQKCYLLESFTVPDNATDIGEYALAFNTSLASVTLGANTKSIGNYAFYKDTKLTTVSLNSKLERIGSEAFCDAKLLSSISFPDSLTTIGSASFRGSGLSSVNIPKNVTFIGEQAFQINNLKNITLDTGNTNFKVTDYVLYQLQDGIPYKTLAFAPASTKAAVSIAEGTQIIGAATFSMADYLTAVYFPDTLTTISKSAFYHCDGITSITLPDSVATLDYGCFNQCSKLKSVALGKSLKNYDLAFANCASLTTITCPADNPNFDVIDNTLYSKDHTIFYCYPNGKVDTVFHLEDEVTTLEAYSISVVPSLEELYVPANTTLLKEYAIACNSSLKSVYFYGDAPDINTYMAFYENASNLIPYKVADSTGWDTSFWSKYTFAEWEPYNDLVEEGSINNLNWTFEGNIGRITFTGTGSIPDYTEADSAPWGKYMEYIQTIEADNVTGIGDYAFYQACKLLRIEAGENLLTIGDCAFKDCEKFLFLDIASVETIGNSAFENNSGINASLIFEKVNFLGAMAFKNCTSLPFITLGGRLTILADDTFAGCTNLTNAMLPETITSIGNRAFRDCISLRTINIPAKVTTICSNAFAGDTSLEKVYFYGGIPGNWTEDSFLNCNNNLTFYYRKTQTQWDSLHGLWNSISVQGLDKFYTEQKDHYSFGNTADSFGYAEDYRIPRQRYVDVLRDIVIGTYYYSVLKRWGGSCFGMTGTTLEFYENSDFNIADYDSNARSVYDISAPNNPKSELTKLIEGYQISQFNEEISGCYGESRRNLCDYDALIQRIEEFERSGGLSVDNQAEPVIMEVYGMLSAHAIVPVSVEQDATGDFKVKVYDPNYPEKLQTLTIYKNLKGISYGIYKYASFINYSTVAKAMSGITLYSDVANTSLYLSINKKAGNVLDENGNGLEDIDGAYEQLLFENSTEDEFPGIRSFVLPEGNYTISAEAESVDDANVTSEADESVTFYMASKDTFAKITSTDANANLNIKQTDTENGELILELVASTEDTGDEASSITLVNATGMERIIEVSSNTATLSIADDETITIEVPEDETVAIDGKKVTTTEGKVDVSFTATAGENPIKLQDLTTEVSCGSSNKLTGTVNASLISNSAEITNVKLTANYLDVNKNIVASYAKEQTVNPGYNAIALEFVNLEATYASDKLEESLSCQLTVTPADDASASLACEETGCVVRKNAIISFDTNGGSEIASVSVAYNSTVSEPIAPTKAGYTFLGWFINGVKYDFKTPVTANLTLTAQWTADTGNNGITDVPLEEIKTPTTDLENGNGVITDGTSDEITTPAIESEKGNDRITDTTSESQKVTSIRITNKNVKIAVGKKIKLTTTVVPANAAIKWTSSNTKWATVNKNTGVVMAKSAGKGKTVTITATATDGSGVKASIKVTIMKHAVKKISLKATSTSVKSGKAVKIKTTVKTTGTNANKTLVWTSSNNKWATVKNGVVTTKKAGEGKTVTITATATDGSGIKASVKIKIMKHAVKKISLKLASKSVKAGEKVKIKATVQTTGINVNKTLAWTSSNNKWATVKNGVVTTKKAGKGKSVTITATSTDGTNKKAKITIKLK